MPRTPSKRRSTVRAEWYMSEGLSARMKAGGEAAIAALLASDGGGINVQDRQGLSPLAWAAQGGMEDTVQRLIARGADVNLVDRERNTALHMVLGLQATQLTIARWLIEAGTDLSLANDPQQDTPLHRIAAHASDKGFAALAVLALSKGASPHATNAHGNTPLHDALQVQQLPWHLQQHAHPSVPNVGALVVNASPEPRDGVVTIAQALLAAGADVNLPNAYGDTPLACAVRSNQWLAADLLVDAGADVNILVDRWTFSERMNRSEEEKALPDTMPLQEKVLQTDPARWARWETLAMRRWARDHLDSTVALPVRPRL